MCFCSILPFSVPFKGGSLGCECWTTAELSITQHHCRLAIWRATSEVRKARANHKTAQMRHELWKHGNVEQSTKERE